MVSKECQQQWTGDINPLFKTNYVSWKRLFANHFRATETPFTLAYRNGDPNKFFCFEIPWRQIISDDHIIWFDSEQENMMNLTRQWSEVADSIILLMNNEWCFWEPYGRYILRSKALEPGTNQFFWVNTDNLTMDYKASNTTIIFTNE